MPASNARKSAPSPRTGRRSSRAPRSSSARPPTNRGNRSADPTTELFEAERQGPTLRVPGIGHLTLPPVEHVAWYGAVALLTCFELVEWPVAAVIMVGKALADNRHSATLQNVGDALTDVA